MWAEEGETISGTGRNKRLTVADGGKADEEEKVKRQQREKRNQMGKMT